MVTVKHIKTMVYMLEIKIFLLIAFTTTINVYGQNLVPNPSFEEMKRCPNQLHLGHINKCLYKWKDPNEGTADYFNGTCFKNKDFGVPDNSAGIVSPVEGNAYVGIVTGTLFQTKGLNSGNYREYIQAKLIAPLQAGETYCVRFFVHHASNYFYTVNQIGAFISDDRVKDKYGNRLNAKPQIISINLVGKTKEWIEVCNNYTATGGETFITIGNFQPFDSTQYTFIKKGIPRSPHLNKAYYFIDDVSVIALKQGESCGCKPAEAPTEKDSVVVILADEDSTFTPGQTITLLTATFGTNKWELPQGAKPLLDSLAAYLKEHPSYKLEVSGFTDNVGQEHANKKLSENRALAVAEYIVSQGISPQRFTYRGYGSDKPLSHNLTEAARAQNRRVEILIKE